MNAAGRAFASRSSARRAPSGTTSSSTTSRPALAACPAPPPPRPRPRRRAGLRSPPRLEQRRDPLPAADALRRDGVAAAAAPQELGGLARDPGAGGAERVAERDRAAVDVDAPGVDAEL